MWRHSAGPPDFCSPTALRRAYSNTHDSGGFRSGACGPQQVSSTAARSTNLSIPITCASSPGRRSSPRSVGIEVIVVEGFDNAGALYPLQAILSDPRKELGSGLSGRPGRLFLRHPPPEIPVLNSLDALTSMESQCTERLAILRLRASSLADLFAKIPDPAAPRWRTLVAYASCVPRRDSSDARDPSSPTPRKNTPPHASDN